RGCASGLSMERAPNAPRRLTPAGTAKRPPNLAASPSGARLALLLVEPHRRQPHVADGRRPGRHARQPLGAAAPEVLALDERLELTEGHAVVRDAREL